jgi:hypothetical protein
MFFPIYFLTTTRNLDIPLSFELDSSVSSKFFHVFIVAIGITNIGGGINVVSNYLILSFKHAFSISISSTDTSSASPVALLMREILEGGTLPRPKYELDFPLILLFFERSLSKINFLEILSNKSFFNVMIHLLKRIVLEFQFQMQLPFYLEVSSHCQESLYFRYQHPDPYLQGKPHP